MDSERIASLASELRSQLWLIQKVSNRLLSRINDGLDTPGQLDSIAYQIHNLYCSVEDLLKLVAKTFENNVGKGGDWHRILLLRMNQPVKGIRPAFLSEASWEILDQLRGFRHVVRHAYGKEIEITQLRVNIGAAQKLYQSISKDVESFINELDESAADATE